MEAIIVSNTCVRNSVTIIATGWDRFISVILISNKVVTNKAHHFMSLEAFLYNKILTLSVFSQDLIF